MSRCQRMISRHAGGHMSMAARPLGFLALLLCVIAALVPAPVAASYLTGTVTDDAGRMLRGATVTHDSPEPKVTALTRAGGRFRLGPLPANDLYFVQASSPGHAPLQATLRPTDDDATLVLVRN